MNAMATVFFKKKKKKLNGEEQNRNLKAWILSCKL